MKAEKEMKIKNSYLYSSELLKRLKRAEGERQKELPAV
jgi:hypothetical protein